MEENPVVKRLRELAQGEPSLTPADRLRIALDLHEAAVEIMQQNLRRSHPGATEDEIAALLVEWLQTRPGAELGDGEGRPVPWPRR